MEQGRSGCKNFIVQELHQILIIDETMIRRTYLVQALETVSGCQVRGINAQHSEVAAALKAPLEIILVVSSSQDHMAELCDGIRANDYTGPIVILTPLNEAFIDEAEEILMLPVSIAHLAGRLKAHISVYESHETAEVALGPYHLKTGLRQLHCPDGRIAKLTEKEVRILRYLQRAQGQAVSREELLQEIWGYDSRLTTHTLETHIYRLRQKSENGSEGSVLLVTEAGGYRLAV